MLCFRFTACCSEALHAVAVILVFRRCEGARPAGFGPSGPAGSADGGAEPLATRLRVHAAEQSAGLAQSTGAPQNQGPPRGRTDGACPRAVYMALGLRPGRAPCNLIVAACLLAAYGQHDFQRGFFCGLAQDNCAAFHVGQLKSHQKQTTRCQAGICRPCGIKRTAGHEASRPPRDRKKFT